MRVDGLRGVDKLANMTSSVAPAASSPPLPAFLTDLKRTHRCGELRVDHIGQSVVLMGWVQTRRDHGGAVFVDLRDRDGVTQVVFRADLDAAVHGLAGELRSEFCIAIQGEVVARGEHVNAKVATGEIEVHARRLEIFSRSQPVPFQIEDDVDTNETVRLKHRYLDLRRPTLQRNFQRRSALYQAVRSYLAAQGFLELETPFLVKYTPGGARNFLVPSRLNSHQFYALAESPQIYKQLFMVSGFDRYFQVVRCFRDEDLRQDRQPEFTQIDLEMSFGVEEDIQGITEGLMASIWRAVLGIELPLPFPRLTYDQAMSRYGVDKPDTRFGLELVDITDAARGSGLRIFEQAVDKGGLAHVIRVPAPQAEQLSRKDLDGLTEVARPYGAQGIGYARLQEGGAWQSPLAKSVTDGARSLINDRAGAAPGDLLLFCAGRAKVVHASLGAVRLHLASRLSLLEPGRWNFLWVTEFPMFEQSEKGQWVACHHPFTAPRLGDAELLESDPGRARARAYDLVLNGNEVAGGSIRIHRSDVQEKVFRALGLSNEEAQRKFGFLLEAFRYGPPPHGGIAAGVDRLAMLLCGAESLRDVIAFPKTQKGSDLMTDAPSDVAQPQLDELHIALKRTPSA
jgi:aspartyl-tRNA synthetase